MNTDATREFPHWESPDGSVLLVNADCLHVLPTLGAVDLLLTDPPYELTATGGGIVLSSQYLSDIDGFTDCGFDESILGRFQNWRSRHPSRPKVHRH